MGERSEYFEDFPEENPANHVGEKFDPRRAIAQREAQQNVTRKISDGQQKLDAEIGEIVRKHRTPN